MTMQIAIVAKNGIALASDTKLRPTKRQFTDNPNSVPSGITNSSKVRLCKRHNIAIAFAGWTDSDALAGQELADHIDSLPAVTDDNIGSILVAWGDDYYERVRPGIGQANGPLLQLLVVRPSKRCPIIKLCVNRYSSVPTSSSYMVSGHESNTAIFWPEYAEADKGCGLPSATSIAAITILMGGEINDHGIGGLEVFRYKKRWEAVPEEEMKTIKKRFARLQRIIKAAMLLSSRRSR